MGATVFYSSSAELATLSNTFSVNNVPTDPTAVTLVVTDPASSATTYNWPTPDELTHGTAGVFSKDIPCPTAGTWQYVWTGTGTASDSTAGTWEVLPTEVGKLYATVEALKSRIGLTAADTVDDFELHQACFSASRWVENECQRFFYRTAAATVRTFEADNWYCLTLGAFNDLVSVASLKTGTGDGTYPTTWTTADYQLLPVNPSAAPEPEPYTEIRAVGAQSFPAAWTGRTDLVQITGVFGWPQVPYGIRQAALIMAEDAFKLKDAPFGVAGFGEYGPLRVGTNRAADRFLAPYRLYPILVG